MGYEVEEVPYIKMASHWGAGDAQWKCSISWVKHTKTGRIYIPKKEK